MSVKKYKTSLSTQTNKTIKSLMVTLAGMIVVLMIAFMGTLSENAEKGYTLEQQKLKNDHLKSENAVITRLVGTSAASSGLQTNSKIKEMEELEAKTYVTREDNKVR